MKPKSTKALINEGCGMEKDIKPDLEQIKRVVEDIVSKFKPNQVILFGSYAYGKPRRDSDVDLLIIMDTSLRPSLQAAQIYLEIEHSFPLDIVVRTPQQVEKRLQEGDFFLQEILAKGVTLYEAPN